MELEKQIEEARKEYHAERKRSLESILDFFKNKEPFGGRYVENSFDLFFKGESNTSYKIYYNKDLISSIRFSKTYENAFILNGTSDVVVELAFYHTDVPQELFDKWYNQAKEFTIEDKKAEHKRLLQASLKSCLDKKQRLIEDTNLFK